MKTYGGVDVQVYIYVIWPQYLVEVIGQLHANAALPVGKASLVTIGYEAPWASDPV
jgi:hypothetical protein